MAKLSLCLLVVVALVCSLGSSCSAAAPSFGDLRGSGGVRVHVESITDDEATTIKIRNRLPTEDVDTLALRCTGELEGKSIGDLELLEVSPYATIWTPDIYGEADLWYCEFEWVGQDLVIGKTDVWKNHGSSVIWMIDSSGLKYFDPSNNDYSLIAEWEKKSSGAAASM